VDEYVSLLDKAYEYVKRIRYSQGTLIELRKKARIKAVLMPAITIISIVATIMMAVLK
jgi:hypothetical protein